MATRIVARYYFGNGDYYDLEGDINDYRYPREINEYYASNPSAIGNWAGSFEKGVTIAAAAFGSIIRGTNKSLRKEWEDGYYEILSATQSNAYGSDIRITSYFDHESGTAFSVNNSNDYTYYSLGEERASIINDNGKLTNIDFLNEFDRRNQKGSLEERALNFQNSDDIRYKNVVSLIGKPGSLVWSHDFQGDKLVWQEANMGITLGGDSQFNDAEIFSYDRKTGEIHHLTESADDLDYFSYSADWTYSFVEGMSEWRAPHQVGTNGELTVFNYYGGILKEDDEVFEGQSFLKFNHKTNELSGASSNFIPYDFTTSGSWWSNERQYPMPWRATHTETVIRDNLVAFYVEEPYDPETMQIDISLIINEIDSGEQHVLPTTSNEYGTSLVSDLHISGDHVAWVDFNESIHLFDAKTNNYSIIDGNFKSYGVSERYVQSDIALSNKWFAYTQNNLTHTDSASPISIVNLQTNKEWVLGLDEIIPGIKGTTAESPHFFGSRDIEIVGDYLIGSTNDLQFKSEWNKGIVDSKGNQIKYNEYEDSMGFFKYNLKSGRTEIIIPDKYTLPSGAMAGWDKKSQSYYSNDKNTIVWAASASHMDGWESWGFSDGWEEYGYLAYNTESGEFKRVSDSEMAFGGAGSVNINEAGDGFSYAFLGDPFVTLVDDIWNPEYGEVLGYQKYLIQKGSVEPAPNPQPDNIINSAPGKGKLRGTRRADQFTFDQFESFSGKTADKIIGFDSSQGDTIGVSAEAFPSLKGADEITFASARTKQEFKALSRQDVDFVYFQDKGRLFFNGNGADKGWGGSDEGGLFAILKGKPELSVEDFTLLA